MIRLSLIVLFNFMFVGVYAQDAVKFKNSENHNWGLKDKSTGIIIAPAIYNRIFDFNDSLIIVSDLEKGMAVYNYHGDLLIDFDNETLFFFMDLKTENCPYDSILHRKLFDCPHFNPRREVNMQEYEINLNRECIPNNYFPCPSWTKIKMNEDSPEYLKLIQKGEVHKWNLNMDSAIYYCKKAIDLDPCNPSIYYWGANLFVLDYIQIPRPKYDHTNDKYFDWIKFCLIKAEELESRTWYKLKILKLKKKFYKDFLKDRDGAKQITHVIRKVKKECK